MNFSFRLSKKAVDVLTASVSDTDRVTQLSPDGYDHMYGMVESANPVVLAKALMLAEQTDLRLLGAKMAVHMDKRFLDSKRRSARYHQEW